MWEAFLTRKFQKGACWVFAAIGSVESQILMKNKISVDLAEQQLLDCDKNDGGLYKLFS